MEMERVKSAQELRSTLVRLGAWPAAQELYTRIVRTNTAQVPGRTIADIRRLVELVALAKEAQ